jgi:hypothetical protein
MKDEDKYQKLMLRMLLAILVWILKLLLDLDYKISIMEALLRK